MKKDSLKIAKFRSMSVLDPIMCDARFAVRDFLEGVLFEELSEQMRSKKYERSRSRRGYFNGYWTRKIKTGHLGKITNVKIPRSRHAFHKLSAVEVYKSQADIFDSELLRGYFFGIKQSDIRNAGLRIFQTVISRAASLRELRKLEKRIEEYRNRKINVVCPYVYLESLWYVINDNNMAVLNPILVAIGCDYQNHLHLLHSKLTDNETNSSWQEFLDEVLSKWPESKNTQTVIYGSRHDLKPIIKERFPESLLQRCINSKISSVLDERTLEDPKNRNLLHRELIAIFQNEAKDEVKDHLDKFIDAWKDVEPRAAEFIREDMDCIINYFNAEKSDQKFVRSTHISRSVFEEISKHTGVIACYRNIGTKKSDFF